jgi:hypothetical protein
MVTNDETGQKFLILLVFFFLFEKATRLIAFSRLLLGCFYPLKNNQEKKLNFLSLFVARPSARYIIPNLQMTSY